MIQVVVALVGAFVLAQFISGRVAFALGLVGLLVRQGVKSRRAFDQKVRELALTPIRLARCSRLRTKITAAAPSR